MGGGVASQLGGLGGCKNSAASLPPPYSTANDSLTLNYIQKMLGLQITAPLPGSA